jgi:hypothetical protein
VPARWILALARRDFAGLASCLDPQVRFRALVPAGPFELTGVEDTIGTLRRWYDGEDDFELLESTVAQVGGRSHLHWRIRLWDADGSGAGRLVEQHAFATGQDRITDLDLLCSGWQPEQSAPRGRSVVPGSRT